MGKLAKVFMSPLNTPSKRFGFILLVGGVLLLIYTVLFTDFGCCGLDLDNVFVRLWQAALHDGYYFRLAPSSAWSVYLVVAGLLLSYFYDWTLGIIVRWVRQGSRDRST